MSYLSELGFSKFWRGKVAGIKGYFYRMDKPLTDEQVEYVSGFSNVSLRMVSLEYAPEIKYDCVFLADKCW